MLTVAKARDSLAMICSLFGVKRDAYYKYIKRFKKRETVKAQVISMVKE